MSSSCSRSKRDTGSLSIVVVVMVDVFHMARGRVVVVIVVMSGDAIRLLLVIWGCFLHAVCCCIRVHRS